MSGFLLMGSFIGRDLKTILLATKTAVLKKHVPKSNAEPDNLLMKVRKQIQIENNVV